MPCKAVQYSDLMVCHQCGLKWDTNDPDPPACRNVTPTFEFEIEPHSDVWVVYTHSHDGCVFFLGYGKLRDFGNKPNLQAHPGYNQYMRVVRPARIKISGEIYPTAREAMKSAAAKFQALKIPHSMYVNPFATHYKHCIIRCLETGDMFPTAKEAAKWAGVTPAQMSQHLNRAAGYPLIKGLTFVKEVK